MNYIIYGRDQFGNNISEEMEISKDGSVTTGRFVFKFLGSNPDNVIDINGIVCNDKYCYICESK